MKNYIIKGVLIVVYFLIALPLRIIFKIKKTGELYLDSKSKYIIASNHPSKLDPFLILASISFREYFRLIPTRFVTSEDYLKKWNYKIFLIPLGCISNKPKNGKRPLEIMEERIKKGETIFIFPRGELEKRGIKSEPKVGAVYIEKNIKDCKIIPVNINFSDKLNFDNLFKRKIITNIKFKKTFRHKEFSKNFQIQANDLMNRIENNGK